MGTGTWRTTGSPVTLFKRESPASNLTADVFWSEERDYCITEAAELWFSPTPVEVLELTSVFSHTLIPLPGAGHGLDYSLQSKLLPVQEPVWHSHFFCLLNELELQSHNVFLRWEEECIITHCSFPQIYSTKRPTETVSDRNEMYIKIR